MKKILLLATVLIFACTKSDLDEINSENNKLNSENKKTNPINSDNKKTNPTDSDNNKMTDGILFDQSTFEKNRKLWGEKKITNYEFSYHETSSAGKNPQIIMAIKNRKFDSVMYKNPDNRHKKIRKHYPYYRCSKTIDDIYNSIAVIANLLKRKAKSKNATGYYSINVQYNSTYHYPTSVCCYHTKFPNNSARPKPSEPNSKIIPIPILGHMSDPIPIPVPGEIAITQIISDFKIKKTNPTDSDNNNMTNRIYFDQSTFKKNRKLWREQKIANYEFSYHERSGVNPSQNPRIIYTVKNRKFDTVKYKDTGYSDKPIEVVYPKYIYTKTIDDIYNDIERRAADLNVRARNDGGSYNVRVTYDNKYHYPTKVSYSRSYKPENLVPGGLSTSMKISDFKIK